MLESKLFKFKTDITQQRLTKEQFCVCACMCVYVCGRGAGFDS